MHKRFPFNKYVMGFHNSERWVSKYRFTFHVPCGGLDHFLIAEWKMNSLSNHQCFNSFLFQFSCCDMLPPLPVLGQGTQNNLKHQRCEQYIWGFSVTKTFQFLKKNDVFLLAEEKWWKAKNMYFVKREFNLLQ